MPPRSHRGTELAGAASPPYLPQYLYLVGSPHVCCCRDHCALGVEAATYQKRKRVMDLHLGNKLDGLCVAIHRRKSYRREIDTTSCNFEVSLDSLKVNHRKKKLSASTHLREEANPLMKLFMRGPHNVAREWYDRVCMFGRLPIFYPSQVQGTDELSRAV